jgi:hypothetical protein
MNMSPTSRSLTPMHEGVDPDEPCVAVTKLRAIDDAGETWDRWCIKHHHWLNEKPAKKLSETYEIRRSEDGC